MAVSVPVKPNPIYDAAQLPVLTRLLVEYTEKSQKLCDELEVLHRRKASSVILASGLFLAFLLVFGFEWVPIRFSDVGMTSPDADTRLIFFLSSAVCVISLLGLAVYIKIHSIIAKSISRKRIQASKTSAQLERLVHRISPIAEFGNVGLGEKLELGLRLADADAALEYAMQYTEKQSKGENGLGSAEIYK